MKIRDPFSIDIAIFLFATIFFVVIGSDLVGFQREDDAVFHQAEEHRKVGENDPISDRLDVRG